MLNNVKITGKKFSLSIANDELIKIEKNGKTYSFFASGLFRIIDEYSSGIKQEFSVACKCDSFLKD